MRDYVCILACWLSTAGCAAAPAKAPQANPASVATATGSVCHFSGSSALPAPSADGTVPVPATHPLVSYTGRMDCQSPGGPMLGFVGASVRLRFRGTAVSLRLKDFGGGTPQTTNYYDVAVDGRPSSVLAVSPAQQSYVLAQGLVDAEHEVELFKRVEAGPGGSPGAGKAQLLGFVVTGSAVLPVALPSRRLEFVGDSITCGYGNEVATTTPESAHYTTRESNGHKAYGALTAALLGARYMAVAYSGRGVSRNYSGAPGQLLPEMYLSSVPEDAAASRWDPAQYVPDAVIINLGTNDFSTPGLDRAAFLARYEQFLATLRGYYPQALLLATLGPMLSDYSPPGANAWTNARADVTAAVAARQEAGDRRVHAFFFLPQQPPYGQDWHPTVATHEQMAQALSAELKKRLGW